MPSILAASDLFPDARSSAWISILFSVSGGTARRGRRARRVGARLGGDGEADRDMPGGDEVGVLEDHRPLDRVLQFPHVARPGVLQEHPLGGRLQSFDGLAELPVVEGDEVPGQRQDIARPLGQRREADGADIEPVEQVLAELVLAAERLQVLVRRRDDADVDNDVPQASDPLESAGLEEPEELGLKAGSRLPISSRKSVPSSASSTSPLFWRLASVNAPFS